MYSRVIEELIRDRLYRGKTIILYGARQVGKTTLSEALLAEADRKSLYLNCDEPDIRLALENRTSTELKQLIGDASFVVIDEAQRVENIGLTLKLLVDRYPEVQVIATGSSSFELANKTKEPLTGRKYEFHLHPLSIGEIYTENERIEMKRNLRRHLIYGMYPEVVQASGADAGDVLRELAGSYLYKDVLLWKDIRRPEVLDRLLRALALQLGNEVSLPELAQLVGVDKHTVATYLDVLEQAFIIFRLMPFSRNLRNELKKLRKIYFWDVGIRNALLNNLTDLELRTDAGALWENFMIAERIKSQQNANRAMTPYFWRTHQQQEVDYVEDGCGKLMAAEFKWGMGRKARIPKAFRTAYPECACQIVTPESFEAFLFDS